MYLKLILGVAGGMAWRRVSRGLEGANSWSRLSNASTIRRTQFHCPWSCGPASPTRAARSAGGDYSARTDAERGTDD